MCYQSVTDLVLQHGLDESRSFEYTLNDLQDVCQPGAVRHVVARAFTYVWKTSRGTVVKLNDKTSRGAVDVISIVWWLIVRRPSETLGSDWVDDYFKTSSVKKKKDNDPEPNNQE